MKLFLSFFCKYLLSPRAGSLIRSVSLVCILGLAVSIASLIVVVSVMSGLGLSIRDRMLEQEPHVVVAAPKQNSKHSLSFLNTVKNPLEQNHQFTVKKTRFFETQDVVVKNSDGVFSGGTAHGYFLEDLRELIKQSGSGYFEDTDWTVNSENDLNRTKTSKIYIDFHWARSLSSFAGDTVELFPIENLLLPVSEMTPPHLAQIQSLVNMPQNQSLFYEIGSFLPQSTASLTQGIEIFLNHPENSVYAKKVLQEQGFSAESWMDRNSSVFFALKIEKIIMVLFLVIAGLISSLSISSMIRLLMTQKKRDIGILMVMGWPRQKIRKLFVSISFMISFIGVAGGLILGYLICLFLQNSSFEILPDFYSDRSFPVEINGYVFFFVGLFSALLIYIVSVIPVYTYTWLSSVELIRKSS